MFAVLFAASGGDPLAPDYVTMGTTLVVFGLLLGILYFAAWGPIMAGLKKREDNIFAARDEATKVKQEAEELRTKLQAEFASANDKIRAMLDEARRDADALKTKEREAGQKEAQTERERARREIEMAKEQALQEIQVQAVKLAALMSSKAVRRTVTPEDHQRLVAESLDELKKQMKA
jgi:F-type H+-transporting ATPase subunit b